MVSGKYLRSGLVLKSGSNGAEVALTQLLLNLYPPTKHAALAVDGIFGEKTRVRVAEFQGSQGLVADGIVGPITAGALCFTINEAQSFANTVVMRAYQGHPAQRRAAFYRQFSQNLVAITPVRAAIGGPAPVFGAPQVVVVVGVVLVVVIVFYIALMNLLPENQKAHREFAKFVQKQLDELREAMNLPTPVQVMQRVVENIRKTVNEFIERLEKSRFNCKPSPADIQRCSKESTAVAVATQNLKHKLEQLTFIGARGFRLDDLVAGILISSGALVNAYSALGKCLKCDDIVF